MADVRLTGITKAWGATAAVEDISFRRPPAIWWRCSGPPAAASRPRLRLIAGLETASAGTIMIAGRDVTRCRPPGAASRWCSRATRCFRISRSPKTSCSACKVRDVPQAERDARLKRAAGILGLEQLLDRKPSQLSGGQQQRVALGRAIVAETRVCLMDEPLSNLDAQLRVEMRREIRALQRRLGMTMLYVTHDQVEAMTMADQVVLMRNGRIEQDAAPAALYERPATIFAARFVGTPPMNVMPAALRCPTEIGERRPADARATRLAVGIRPEAARIAADGMPATRRGGRISRRRHADRYARRRINPSSCACRAARRVASATTCRHPLGAGGRALVRSVDTMSYRSTKTSTTSQQGGTSWTADSF